MLSKFGSDRRIRTADPGLMCLMQRPLPFTSSFTTIFFKRELYIDSHCVEFVLRFDIIN